LGEVADRIVFELIEPAALPDAVSNAMAPAFVLAAMSGWVGAMANGLARITDRVRYLLDREQSGSVEENLANLKALARTIEHSMLWMISGAAFIVMYVILSFILQIFSLHYYRLIIYIFALAFVCFLIALVWFGRSVWLRRNNRRWL
jgi:hypothetical protein